jgi:hypothetical protein
VIAQLRGSCADHRATLLDFVERRERSGATDPTVTAATGAALAHLERCAACEEELAGIVRTIAALGRLRRSVASEEPPSESWSGLLDRLSRPAPAPWRWRLSLGGLMMSAVAVALLTTRLIGPSTIPSSPSSDATLAGFGFVDRSYDPPGFLSASTINALAGVDVSIRASLRSHQAHGEPASVDRYERDRTARLAAAPKDARDAAAPSPRTR